MNKDEEEMNQICEICGLEKHDDYEAPKAVGNHTPHKKLVTEFNMQHHMAKVLSNKKQNCEEHIKKLYKRTKLNQIRQLTSFDPS
jgi:formyltetrahydrofolate hydrolase